MRKIVLIFSALIVSMIFCAFKASADTAENGTPVELMTTNWANKAGTVYTLEGAKKGMSMIGNFCANDKDEAFFIFDYYAKSPGFEFARYGDNGPEMPGFDSSAVNGNANFGLHKIDKDGNLLLTVYSDRGSYDKGNSGIAATADGGFIVAMRVRLADGLAEQDGRKVMLRLHTSADPAYVCDIETPELPVDSDHGNIYVGMVVKFDADGKVQWHRLMTADYEPAMVNDKPVKCTAMIEIKGVEAGSDGNFYVAGKFKRDLTIEGCKKVYTPRNIPENWNYSDDAGDLFLVKFDKDGNHKWTFTNQEGSFIKHEGITDFSSDDEAIYITGYLNGSATEVQKAIFGGVTVDVPNERSNMFYLKLNYIDNANASDETLKVEYANVFKGVKDTAGKQRMKPMGIWAGKDEIVMTGSFNGIVYDPQGNEIMTCPTTALTGYVITADKTTGAFKKAVCVKETGETETAHVVGDSIYVSCYGPDVLSGMGSAVMVAALDKESLNVGKLYHVFVEPAMCTNQGSVLMGNTMLLFSRNGADTQFHGIEPMQMRSKWDVMVNSVTLTGIKEAPTSVAAPVITPNGGEYVVGKDMIEVEITCADEAATLEYKLGETGSYKTYTAPLLITNSREVYAKATLGDLTAESKAVFTFTKPEYTFENLNSNWAKQDGAVFAADDSYKSGMSMVGSYSKNSQDEVYYMYDFYTKADWPYTQFGDGEKFYGFADSKETNGNPNLGLNKIDRDGNLIWTVYSDFGYFNKSCSAVAGTADGGAVIAVKVRMADRVAGAEAPILTLHTSKDAAYKYEINEPEIPQGYDDKGWVYRGYMLKLDKDGKVEWRKDFPYDYTTIESGGRTRKRSDMLDFKAITVGADGNIYLAGRFASPLTIDGKVYQPSNLPEGWNYDFVQSGAAGDMFLAKFDMKGNRQWVMTHADGSFILNENPKAIAADDKAVYLSGTLQGQKGTEGQQTSFGGHSVTLKNDRNALFCLKVDYEKNAAATDETVVADYLKVFSGSKGLNNRQNIKPMNMNVGKEEGVDDVALVGSFEGVVEDENGNVIMTNQDRTGFPWLLSYVIKLDKNTGDITGHANNEEIMEYESVDIFRDSIMVSGYDKGVQMVSYSKGDMNVGKIYDISDCTNTQGAVRCGNKFVMFNRTGNDANVHGLPTMPKRSGWDLVINGFTMPGIEDTPSGVDSVAEDNAVSVYGGDGFVSITSGEACGVTVYSISGVLVNEFNAQAGTTVVELPAGFYIVNGKKVVVY